MSLIRLEAAIWALMANKQKGEIFPAELKSFRLVLPNVGNSPTSERLASAQKTAKNLWDKRRDWEEKREEEDNFNSFQNQTDSSVWKKRQLSNVGKENNSKEKISKGKDDMTIGSGGCLEEFNLLYNNVEASLEQFWNR